MGHEIIDCRNVTTTVTRFYRGDTCDFIFRSPLVLLFNLSDDSLTFLQSIELTLPPLHVSHDIRGRLWVMQQVKGQTIQCYQRQDEKVRDRYEGSVSVFTRFT